LKLPVLRTSKKALASDSHVLYSRLSNIKGANVYINGLVK